MLGIHLILGGMNVAVWTWAWITFHSSPALLSTALLAYTLGLRHALDADHVAAIDNLTRRLIQEKRQPLMVGFFFSLGHSLLVILVSILVSLASMQLDGVFQHYQALGSWIATIVSIVFLFIVAFSNLRSLGPSYSLWRRLKAGKLNEKPHVMNPKGNFHVLNFAFRFVSKSWHVLLLGILFGLGFGTATEIALLSLTASQAMTGIGISIIIFPLLFTFAMCWLDTINGHLMLGAYGWEPARPIRQLFYNLLVTGLSALIAIGVALVQMLNLFKEQLNYSNFWLNKVIKLNDHFDRLGGAILAGFMLIWFFVFALSYWEKYRYRKHEYTKNPQKDFYN
jgi:high-affinity nickel-transport protein